MNSWTDMHDHGQHHLQMLLDEADKQRQIKRITPEPGLLDWLRQKLTRETVRPGAGALRPIKAKE